MNLSVSQEQQHEMRRAYFDGAPGILVSGLVWVTAAAVCFRFGVERGVWTLLIGGALIHPIGTVVTKAVGRSGETSKGNALNPLAAASTVWLILCCAMAYGLFLLDPRLFFPAMMATIGSRYLVFATVFGRSIYLALGGCLIVAAVLVFYAGASPAVAAGVGGVIEVVFALVVFAKASKAEA